MAQSEGRKKTNTKKASAGKKNSRKKSNSKNNKQITIFEFIARKEFTSTLIFISGLILLIIALFSGGEGSFWNNLHSLYFGVFGICGYYIPLAVLFFGVVSMLNKHIDGALMKAGEVFLAFVLVCGILHVNFFADVSIDFVQSLKNVIASSHENGVKALLNGGAVGAVFGGAIFQMCKSKVLSTLILVLVFLADIMLLFGISLVKIFMKMEKPAKRVGEITEDVIEKGKADREKKAG